MVINKIVNKKIVNKKVVKKYKKKVEFYSVHDSVRSQDKQRSLQAYKG